MLDSYSTKLSSDSAPSNLQEDACCRTENPAGSGVCKLNSPPRANSMLRKKPRSAQPEFQHLLHPLLPGPAAASTALAAWTCRPAANQDVDSKDEKKHDLGNRNGLTSCSLVMLSDRRNRVHRSSIALRRENNGLSCNFKGEPQEE